MNTLIEYMYRDANNYKQHERLIVVGKVDIDAFNKALDNEGGFIPSQIGLEDLQERFADISQDSDHVWHEPIEITHTERETNYAVKAADINKLVKYQGGGYEGCWWEWNFFMYDQDGEFYSIIATGQKPTEMLT